MKKEYKVIGKPAVKLDARQRAMGASVYGHDLTLAKMLYGAILRSRYPSARIRCIDVSEAARMPGVKAVITADDVDVQNISYKRDHPVLKKGDVNCIRDEIAAVAATSKELAKKALEKIKVEYDPREGIFDPNEALKKEAPRINKFNEASAVQQPGHPGKNIADTFHYSHGDLEAQKAKSDCIVTRKYTLPRVTHCCMATSNITADYSPSEKKLTLYASTQVPYLYQRDMARTLKMDPSGIRIVQPVIGGGFGSKLDMYPFEPICALLSMKTSRPVQLIYDREEEFLASPTRQPMIMEVTTGADKEGRFTFREAYVIKDNGAYSSWGATTSFVIMQTFSSLYQVPACKYDAFAVYTNNPYAGSFRGYGNPQGTFAVERNIDIMAEELGIDKDVIRKKNANYKGEVTGQKLRYETCGHREALDHVIQKTQTIRKTAKEENQKNKRYKKGLGYASMLHVGGGAKIYRSDGCGTTVQLDDYGRLTIISGSNEIGQGSETVLAMIASEELGMDPAHIKVENSDTNVKPWDVGVHASRTSFVAGNSLLGALKILKKKLSAKAAEMLDSASDDLEFTHETIRAKSTGKEYSIGKVVRAIHFNPPHELCQATYFYEPASSFQDKGFKGNVSGTYAFASQAIEVLVDTYTGNVAVQNVHVSQDVGKVLNPLGLSGQIEGGVVMGMGYALTEELKTEQGYVQNPDFHDYKLPTFRDIPKIHFYPVETHDKQGPYGAKGVGEAPLIPTPAAIANAVCEALGVEINALPVSPENVLAALKKKRTGDKVKV